MIDFILTNEVFSAILSGLCLPIYHLILMWIWARREQKHVKSLVIISFCFTVITWITLSKVLTRISFLADSSNEISLLNIIDSLFVLGFFFIGYIEFYSLIRRGYSLKILCELYSRNVPMTAEEIAVSYSGNMGLDWFLKKRLSGLVKLGLIRIDGDKVQLSRPTGKMTAKAIHFTKRALSIKDSG